MKYDHKEYYRNEVKLAAGLLRSRPDDEVQKNRLAYASFQLGNLEIAKLFATSEKVKWLIANAR